MRPYGIEIEFISKNYYKLFEVLKKYDCVITFDTKYSNKKELILKPEATVRGCELNIPPGFNELENLCKDLQPLATFNERCAMHIHVSSKKLDLEKLKTYYINNEAEIISEAGNLYTNLNFSNSMKVAVRKKNMNIDLANMKHGTVEHRIYKSSFDYIDIMFAVTQTLQIIEESQK